MWASFQGEGRISTQTRMSYFNKRNAKVTFFAKHDGRAALQNVDLKVCVLTLIRAYEPAFQYRHESVSLAFHHQSEVHVQPETHLSAMTNNNYWINHTHVLSTEWEINLYHGEI